MIVTDMEELALIHPRLEMKISPRARRLALRLDPQRRIMRLVVPRRAPKSKALAFARQHRRWIHEKMESLPAQIPFSGGAVIPVFGQDRTIRVNCDITLKRTSITLTENEIMIFSNKEDIAGRLTRFLKKLVEEKLDALASEKAARIGKTVASLQIRDTKSRWGSCGSGGRLSFSWRIIFAPPEALDYLVAHEVAHMVHMNHGREFWALCRDLSADYETGKKWMRNHGHELLRYGG